MTSSPSSLTRKVTEDLRTLLRTDADSEVLVNALRYLAKWRAQLLEGMLLQRNGSFVQSGPFSGMKYDVPASEGARIARLIGCYEQSLAPVIEDIVTRSYDTIWDIGCAEGYYAVGLARRMPSVLIRAHDINPKARESCARLAEMNGVSDRVRVGGEVDHAALANPPAAPTALICDIEGAEDKLLDPKVAPGLAHMDMLVEVHEGMRPGLVQRLSKRFEPTHTVQRIDRSFDSSALPPWMEELSDLDRLLALWEWRASPTPWLWMRANG